MKTFEPTTKSIKLINIASDIRYKLQSRIRFSLEQYSYARVWAIKKYQSLPSVHNSTRISLKCPNCDIGLVDHMSGENRGNSMMIGQIVKVKVGASAWMKSHSYWLPDMGESIDGMSGYVVSDYTDLRGADAHYGVTLNEAMQEVGVHPDLLEYLVRCGDL